MRRLLLSLSLGTLLVGCGGVEGEASTPSPPAEQAASEDPSRSAQGEQCWCGYWCQGNENYCLQYCHNICLDQTT